jgi:ribonuclease J
VVHLELDPDTGNLRSSPEIISKGFVFVRDAEELFEHARGQIDSLAEEFSGEELKAAVDKKLSKFFYSETKRRPMVFVFTSTTMVREPMGA